MMNNSLVFWLGYCKYIGANFHLSPSSLPTKTATIIIKDDITPRKIIKRGLKEDMTHFLQMPNKLFSKKRKQINQSKRKANIREISLRKTTINSLESSDKKELPVSILITKKLKFKAKNIDLAKISIDVYSIVCLLKRS